MTREIGKNIVVNSKVRFGKPVIKGTRTPVDLVVGKIAGGMKVDDVMKEYELTKKQIFYALQYAADLVSQSGSFLG